MPSSFSSITFEILSLNLDSKSCKADNTFFTPATLEDAPTAAGTLDAIGLETSPLTCACTFLRFFTSS